MPTKSELWDMIDAVVKAEGLELFELELPNSRSGVLRVYICREAGGEDKVGIGDCTRVSKQLSAIEGFEDLFDRAWTLEVSSPGINRRLTRPEHFRGAVGERVRIKVTETAQRSSVVKGVIRSFANDEVTIDNEDTKEAVTVPLQRINEARVDFLFSKKG